MENVEIAAKLDETADLLELTEASPFRARAYRNAARVIEDYREPVAHLVERGDELTRLPSIGADMAKHLTEIVQTGTLKMLERLLEKVPRSLIAVTRVPNVGPKRARLFWETLGITSIDELELAAREGKVAQLERMGKKTQDKIVRSIEEFRRHTGRMPLADAEAVVKPLVAYLEETEGLERLEVAGSYRRRKETVGDLDVLVQAADPHLVMQRLVDYPKVKDVLAHGETKSSVVLWNDLQVDMRILPEESFGAGLLYFTGSKEHNIKLRQRAVERSWKLSEYGLFAGGEANRPTSGRRLAGRTEADVYEALGLTWVAPELREDRGELVLAERGALPDLVSSWDLRGDLQMHSRWSDGKNTIEEMLLACKDRGYDYFALTDHSKALAMTGGLDENKVREQWEEIRELQAQHEEIRILRSLEVDILKDGSLDMPDEILAGLDLVVISIHSAFDLPEAEQTERLIRALSHPRVNILAHPTGRIINRRHPIQFDLQEVFACARENNVALEMNGGPSRLDLNDILAIRAQEAGVKLVISSDAHHRDQLEWVCYGIDQARRAQLGKEQILNTLPLPEFAQALGLHLEGLELA